MVSPEMELDFPYIYDRIASLGWVGFKGAWNEDILNGRIDRIRKICRKAAKNADNSGTKKKLVGKARMYAGLQLGGFAEEFIRRADMNPKGVYGLSQKYGYERAMQVRRERAAKELGSLRKIQRARKRKWVR